MASCASRRAMVICHRVVIAPTLSSPPEGTSRHLPSIELGLATACTVGTSAAAATAGGSTITRPAPREKDDGGAMGRQLVCIRICVAIRGMTLYLFAAVIFHWSDTHPMAAEIINLRQARKRKARAEKEAKAAVSRKQFGESKSQIRHREAIAELENLELSGKQIVSSAAAGPDDRE